MTKDIFATLVSRRSISKFTDQPISTETLNAIFEAGTFAPVHKRTDPWRFVVFEGKGREILSEAMAKGFQNANADAYPEKLQKIKNKPFTAPTVVLVWCAAGRGKVNPPVWEDHAAVSACIQNMSLAAHGFGLGSIWRSGPVWEYPEVQALCKTADGESFDAEKGDHVMGLLYIGYPDCNYPEPTRFPNPPKVEYFK